MLMSWTKINKNVAMHHCPVLQRSIAVQESKQQQKIHLWMIFTSPNKSAFRGMRLIEMDPLASQKHIPIYIKTTTSTANSTWFRNPNVLLLQLQGPSMALLVMGLSMCSAGINWAQLSSSMKLTAPCWPNVNSSSIR